MNGVLYGVSVGPGDPELMTLKAVAAVRACPVLAVPVSGGEEMVALSIARAAVPEAENKEILYIDTPMTRDEKELLQARQQGARQIAQHLAQGKDVAFLTLADVSIYSTYGYIQAFIVQQGYKTHMIAGVPSFCAAAARLGRMLAQGEECIHIMPASKTAQGLSLPGTKVLMKSGKRFGEVRALLQEHGLCETAQIVERCGMEGERVWHSVQQADENAGYFSVIIV